MQFLSIKTILKKEEKDRLCLILRNFKKNHDISSLRDGINSIESNEFKDIILKTMNPHLRDKILSS